jgi:hypothetical protein
LERIADRPNGAACSPEASQQFAAALNNIS